MPFSLVILEEIIGARRIEVNVLPNGRFGAISLCVVDVAAVAAAVS